MGVMLGCIKRISFLGTGVTSEIQVVMGSLPEECMCTGRMGSRGMQILLRRLS
jgi:hypothetical protein